MNSFNFTAKDAAAITNSILNESRSNFLAYAIQSIKIAATEGSSNCNLKVGEHNEFQIISLEKMGFKVNKKYLDYYDVSWENI